MSSDKPKSTKKSKPEVKLEPVFNSFGSIERWVEVPVTPEAPKDE